jgi:hypothetical protein
MKYRAGQLWYNPGGKFLVENVSGDFISIFYIEKNQYRVWNYEDLVWQTEADVYIGEISSLEKELL